MFDILIMISNVVVCMVVGGASIVVSVLRVVDFAYSVHRMMNSVDQTTYCVHADLSTHN